VEYLGVKNAGISYNISIAKIENDLNTSLDPCNIPISSRPNCSGASPKQSLDTNSISDRTPKTLHLYNLYGIEIKHLTANEINNIPEIQELKYLGIPSGVYIIVTRNAGGQIIESKKVFIQ